MFVFNLYHGLGIAIFCYVCYIVFCVIERVDRSRWPPILIVNVLGTLLSGYTVALYTEVLVYSKQVVIRLIGETCLAIAISVLISFVMSEAINKKRLAD